MLEGFEIDPNEARREVTRRRFLMGATAAALGLGVYAATGGRHELETVRQTIAVRNLPESFRGFRMVHISDIHLEEYTEPWFLHRVVEKVNGLAPELVVITGDYISKGPVRGVAYKAMPVCAEALSRLSAPLRYAALGNHDVTVNAGMVMRHLSDRGIVPLRNRSVAIERGGDRLWLAGVDDPGKSVPDLTMAVPQDVSGPVILLAHEPDYADVVRRHPRGKFVDLMLAGHSHGGQVRLPWIGPLVLPPMGKKYVHGHFDFGGMQLYVNRGIGTVGLPLRLDCPPEITEITLQRA